MITINLINFMDVIEDFVLAKLDIEEYQKGQNPEYQKMPVVDFISQLQSKAYIYMIEDKTISFTIYEGVKHKYMIYTSDNEDVFEGMLTKLKKIDYDFNLLVKQDYIDVINNELTATGIFYINSSYYTV